MRRVLCLASGFALATALALPLATGAPSANAQEPGLLPYFAVSPIDPPDHMWGQEWVADAEVLIEIDDPDNGVGVDFSTNAPTDENGHFELYDMPFDIEAGQLVTVTQGATVKDHVVIDLTVTQVDPVNDTVSGIGKPNTETVVWVGDDQESLNLTVTSDSTGAWVADFSSTFDILPGMMTYTYEADEDGDQTQIDYFVVEVVPTLDQLLDDMVADGRLPNEGIANSIMKQAEKAPLKALTNHLSDLVRDGAITQLTMDQILVIVAK